VVHSLLHRRFYIGDESCMDRLGVQLELPDYPLILLTEFFFMFMFDPLSL